MLNPIKILKAASDETRLRMLHILTKGELCVCDIMAVLGVPQSTASRHLARLKNAGLVQDRRQDQWMHYSLTQPVGVLHRTLLDWLTVHGRSEIPKAKQDLVALNKLPQCAASSCKTDRLNHARGGSSKPA